jgi:hypothetical protein
VRNPYMTDPGPDEPDAWQLRGACHGQWDLFSRRSASMPTGPAAYVGATRCAPRVRTGL